MLWIADFLCTKHFVHSGAMGVRLKSYGLLSMTSTEILGLSCDGQRRLSMSFFVRANVPTVGGKIWGQDRTESK